MENFGPDKSHFLAVADTIGPTTIFYQYFGYGARLVRHSQTIVFDCVALNVRLILTVEYKLLKVINTVRIIAYR